jgi:hypothetical protein
MSTADAVTAMSTPTKSAIQDGFIDGKVTTEVTRTLWTRVLIGLAVALAEGFKEDYAGGYADVEGFYRAGGGERD